MLIIVNYQSPLNVLSMVHCLGWSFFEFPELAASSDFRSDDQGCNKAFDLCNIEFIKTGFELQNNET